MASHIPTSPHSVERSLIRSFPFLKELPEEERQTLLESLSEVRHEGGKVLVEDGTVCENFYFVLEGTIRVYKLTAEGRELTLYRIGKGEACLLTLGCIMGDVSFNAVAQVERRTRLLSMPSYLFRDMIRKSPTFQHFIFRKTLTALTEVMALTEEVTFHSVNTRVADQLLKRRSRQDSPTIAVTHEALAAELGTAREVVSRMLKEFEKKGWVKLQRGRITLLDEGSLQELRAG